MATNFAESVDEVQEPAVETDEEVVEESEVIETEEEAAAEPDASEEEDSEEPEDSEDEPEAWEFDAGGTKLTVDKSQLPEDVAQKVDGFLKTSWANVTKKSQEIATERKAVEDRVTAIETIAALQGDVMDTYARGVQARNELERLGGVNLAEMWQTDPDQARQISDRMAQLQAEWQQAITEVDQKETAFKNAQSQERQRQIEAGKETMDKRIKGFSTEKAPAVIDYVVETYGMTREQAESEWPLNPVTAEMAYKAMLYDKAQAKLTKPRKSEPPRPMRKTRGGAGATNAVNPKSADSDRISSDEWLKRRNAQLRKRR